MHSCTIDGIRVDLDALRALRHDCVPEQCIGRERGCCETYEVIVDREEIGTIVGTLPQAAKYARHLKSGGEFVDPIDESEGGGDCLATHRDGRCVFAYRAANGMTLCSLHSAGIDLGLEPFKVKPKACALWPLYFVEGNNPLLTVQDGALAFPCNHKRRTAGRGLDPGVAHIVRTVFGDAFLAAVLARL
jgi:hypothetical protein